MPELPEVEVIRRDLEREVVGRKIADVEVYRMRTIRRHPNKTRFKTALVGRKIISVGRRGKYLVLRLDNESALVIHLGMSGRLLREKSKKSATLPHTQVVITFTQGGKLCFVDPRQFGEMFVTSLDELDNIPELQHLGFDPIEDPISWIDFGRRISERKAKLKSLLMDQEFISGIGNIYSDEILFEAGLRYDRRSDSLTSQEVRRLSRAIQEVLHEAIKHRGTTAEDEQYVDLFGEPGSFQTVAQVYQRTGKPSPRCRTPIERAKFGGRHTWYCPQCQS
ncbi:MAG: formamidopyrimidine-DNA glycosylase [Acidimicrobiia bacterium]